MGNSVELQWRIWKRSERDLYLNVGEQLNEKNKTVTTRPDTDTKEQKDLRKISKEYILIDLF